MSLLHECFREERGKEGRELESLVSASLKVDMNLNTQRHTHTWYSKVTWFAGDFKTFHCRISSYYVFSVLPAATDLVNIP